MLIPQHHALTHSTFQHIAVFISWSVYFSFLFLFFFFLPPMKQCIFNFCLRSQGLSGCLRKVAPLFQFALCFTPYSLISLHSLIASFSSTRNRFQLFMPIFHKYLGDGISKQTMPGDTNPRLQQRSFNALEIWPAVDRHLLLSSAASQQQCWHSKYVYRSSVALTPHWGAAGIILKQKRVE